MNRTHRLDYLKSPSFAGESRAEMEADVTRTHRPGYLKSLSFHKKLCGGVSCKGIGPWHDQEPWTGLLQIPKLPQKHVRMRRAKGPQHDQDPQTQLHQQRTEKTLMLMDYLKSPSFKKSEGEVMPRNRTLT